MHVVRITTHRRTSSIGWFRTPFFLRPLSGLSLGLGCDDTRKNTTRQREKLKEGDCCSFGFSRVLPWIDLDYIATCTTCRSTCTAVLTTSRLDYYRDLSAAPHCDKHGRCRMQHTYPSIHPPIHQTINNAFTRRPPTQCSAPSTNAP